jgi:iron complex outermembrane recepter protein
VGATRHAAHSNAGRARAVLSVIGSAVRYAGLALLLSTATDAWAQRAAENVTTGAEDGFGSSIGSESVGIYADGEVRGFSAYEAGNARIEGLYYDEAGGITDLLQNGSDIRVGLSAFGHPFPAPTGIVDTTLRRVTLPRPVVSARVGISEFWGVNGSVEAAIPVTANLGVNAALGYFADEYIDGASAWFVSYGAVTRWQPTPGVEVTGLFSRYDYGDEEQGPAIYTAGAFLPPRIARRRFFGQDWAQWAGHSQNIGGMVRSELGPWRIDAGLFSSRFTQDDYASTWFDNVGRDGRGDRIVLSGQDQRFASVSGEFRVTRDVREGPRRHRFIASLRGRNRDSDFGGFDIAAIGPGIVGVSDPVAEPVRNFGPLTRDAVRQRNYAVGYELLWREVGELNLGLTRSDYQVTVRQPGAAKTSQRDRIWLWNAALALNLTDNLSLYAATTRGLEESGTAPSNAANADQVLPALRTRQMEAGLRFRVTENIRLVAAVFDLRKPYFEIDTADNVFRTLGQVRHRGIEFSASGTITEGLTVVTGGVFLDPVVTGEAVDDGRLGRRPIGRTRLLVDASLDWRLPFAQAWSVDARLLYEGDRYADAQDQLTIPQRATLDLGARYRFQIGRSPAVLRFRLANATNVYGWRVFGGGGFLANAPRRASVSITADF